MELFKLQDGYYQTVILQQYILESLRFLLSIFVIYRKDHIKTTWFLYICKVNHQGALPQVNDIHGLLIMQPYERKNWPILPFSGNAFFYLNEQ